MKKKILVTVAVTGLAATAYLVMGNIFYGIALKSKRKKGSEQEITDTRHVDNRFLAKNPPIEKFIHSADNANLELHAAAYHHTERTHKWVIVLHGYTSHNREMTQWVHGFYEKGFNVLTPDLRGHGLSEGKYIGMGWHDRLDILSWINTLVSEDSEAEIILFGMSMGGATVMMLAGEDLPNNVKVIIEDSGFTSAGSVLSHQLKEQLNVPDFPALYAADSIAKLRAGYGIFEASATDQLAKAKLPILFIHGEDDTFVPYDMMEELYEATNTEKKKLTIPGAEHTESINVNPELYWKTVWEFVGRFMAV